MNVLFRTEHVIDCDIGPVFVPPQGTVVVEHQRRGKVQWDPAQMTPFVFDRTRGKLDSGAAMHKRLVGRLAPNANILDYLLAHKDLIPEDWKNKIVFFGGTIYRDAERTLFARCLTWHEQYGWGDTWLFLAADWNDDGLATLRAS